MDYLALACQKLNIAPGEVISHKVYPDRIALVVRAGQKHVLMLDELQPPELPVKPDLATKELDPAKAERRKGRK